jgi:hypothetical protein
MEYQLIGALTDEGHEAAVEAAAVQVPELALQKRPRENLNR